MVAYPLSVVCFALGVFFLWRWRTTLPMQKAYFEKLKPRTFKCPYCSKRIDIDEIICPYCKSKIPR